jgi:predicted HAD superfamily Cof-like phosphohydrolase
MSYFERVLEFNRTFGVKTHETLQKDIFDTEPESVDFAMRLIREEMQELEDAVKDKDYVETADAIGDSIYVLLGLSARIGVNMDDVFARIHNNNMTKACSSADDAVLSVDYYRAHPELGYLTPNYRESNGRFIVFNESSKKILKAHTYIPVNLQYLIE